MMPDEAARAARNNAAWCDAMAFAHGSHGAIEGALWINRGPAPRFHPNIVTLSPGAGDDARRAAADLKTLRPDGFAVKDSFSDIDLADLGFGVLFEARWLALAASRDLPPVPPAIEVAGVRTDPDLVAWERLWGSEAADERVFPPTLLERPEIRFYTVLGEAKPLAIAAVNESGDAAGVSNLVFLAEDQPAALLALLHAIRAEHPGLPIVGYERGEELDLCLSAGFDDAGPLRIWAI